MDTTSDRCVYNFILRGSLKSFEISVIHQIEKVALSLIENLNWFQYAVPYSTNVCMQKINYLSILIESSVFL